MLARFGGTTSAAVLLAFSASGEWMTLAPPGDPPTLFSVTGTVASAAVRNNAPVPAEGARTSPQQILPTRLPPPDGSRIAELARSLDNDWRKCFRFVRDHVAYTPYFGFLRGAERTLLDMEGNDADQSLLLVELLRACGHSGARVLYEPCANGSGFAVPLYSHGGQLPFNAASWFGVDEGALDVQSVLNEVFTRLSTMRCAVRYFYDAAENRHFVKTSRFWVSLAADGETHNLDPAFKPCRRRAQRDFAADMGLSDAAGRTWVVPSESLLSPGEAATATIGDIRFGWLKQSLGQRSYWGVPME